MTECMGETGITPTVKSTTETVTLMANGLGRNGHGMARWFLVVMLVTILTDHSTSGELQITYSLNTLVTIIGVTRRDRSRGVYNRETLREVYFLVE